MNIGISGLPALIVEVGSIVVFSLPVWFASRIVGADSPTLFRSAASLVVGVIGSLISIAVGGGFALLMVPISFLLSFKFVLGTSVFGSIVLAVLALAGYAAMIHFVGAGFDVSGNAAA